MLRLISPKDAPSWFASVLQQIERAIRERSLPEFDSAELPDPEPFRGTQILVTDLEMTMRVVTNLSHANHLHP